MLWDYIMDTHTMNWSKEESDVTRDQLIEDIKEHRGEVKKTN